MFAAAIALIAIGSLGIWVAVVLEVKTHDSIYKVLMKIFPWFFGVGAVILALAITEG